MEKRTTDQSQTRDDGGHEPPAQFDPADDQTWSKPDGIGSEVAVYLERTGD